MSEIVDLMSRAGNAQVIVKDPKEHIQGFWSRGQFFETRLLEYIYWHYKGRVFVDVGSHLGNHSLFFAKFCEPNKVISIEPHGPSIEHQRENLKLNGVQNRVVTFNCALSDYDGRGSIRPWESNPAYYLGSLSLHEGDDVEVHKIDTLLADARHINLVKIDVEMHELRVLGGALDFLSRERPALFVEIRSKGAYSKVRELLKPLGYGQVGSHFQEGQVFEFTVHR